jgi:hypothetical protein
MKRKRYFRTKAEAKKAIKEYKPKTITDPTPEQMKVFRLKGKYFAGSVTEYEFEAYT